MIQLGAVHILLDEGRWGMSGVASQLLIATCRALAGLEGMDDAPMELDRDVERSADPRHLRTAPDWNARFVQHCGFWALYDHVRRESAWPFPPGLTLRELGAMAKQLGALHETPAVGDLFLLHSPTAGTFVHTGVIAEVRRHGTWDRRPYCSLYTIEGDIDREGQPYGGRTMRGMRTLWPASGDRFIRWASLVRDESLSVTPARTEP